MYEDCPNPYDKGCGTNCWTILFGPKPSSLLPDFAEVLVPPGVTGKAPVREEVSCSSLKESTLLLSGTNLPRYGEAEEPLAAIGGHIPPV